MQKSGQKMDPHKIVAQVGAGLTTSSYKKNQDIFVQGEAADSVHFIQEGRIKATVTSEHGKEAVVGIFGKGQFFGEGCLTDQSLRTATMSALGDCQITSITKAKLRKRRWPAHCPCDPQSGNTRRYYRHDSIPRELLYEQISQAGFDRLQRKNRCSPIVAKCCSARQARDQGG
jgi:CRP-like cAMP-binding protein